LEVSDLLADPTESLANIRRKGEEGRSISRAEWTVVAHFIRLGLEASSSQAPNLPSRESFVSLLDAFLSVYALRKDENARLDQFYLGNLPAESRPTPSQRAGKSANVRADLVRRAVRETRRLLSDPATAWRPTLIGRNFYVLVDEDSLAGAEDISRALRPFWPVLWTLAARGHFVEHHAPVREHAIQREGLYQPSLPDVTDGKFKLEFVRRAGHEFAVILTMPGVRGPVYPIVAYPQIVEFRTMLEALVSDHELGDWTGAYFFADVIAKQPAAPVEIWFRAHDNGVTLGFSLDEWKALDTLFRRVWEMPEIRRATELLALEYGEL
ncbi:MAG TPA: hypothetical protein VFP77_09335, partial [Gemmatimonadaceae bacterium]|nr:hypothetical protein [Gemmatimonadaceae bacterium]